ncbi:MAG TPA: LamG-like jellyroll fold domain-containing protein, partial [Saprospiraceae bacterium]|nr:LamG-like jellyroll fold domain-containing protein [Saprospiraceae bacterium]
MRYIPVLYTLMLLCSCLGKPLIAQNNACGPEEVLDTNGFIGTAFFNYGSQSRAKTQNFRSAVAVGQIFVGYTEGLNYNSTIGFYSRFLLPPFALKVTATQGDLLDRIQVSWDIDALGPSPNDGFNIYRDDVFLATVGPNIRNYNDFNVIAGRPYTYKVRGLNAYGEGSPGTALGFQVPNGVVTGWISTLSGSPVPDALVTLTPMQGFSAKFDPTQGAFAVAEAGQNPFLPTAGDDWTVTFWIKTNNAADQASVINMKPFPLYIRALNSSSGDEGVDVSVSGTGDPFLSATFPDSNKNDWHHVALSYDGSSDHARLYIDGVLAGIAPMNAVPSADTVNIGGQGGNGEWTGRMDELRIYHRKLDELDFGQVMEGTASSQTPFLSHYWKMDEELGVKSYDIIRRHKMYFCGATFDADRPPVHTAGITNEDGYYQIESASYGTGTTFLAQPKKNFYMHRALKMNRDEEDYASLPDFPITPKATIEIWVNSAGPDGTQCLLSKKWGTNEFRLMLEPNGLDNDIVIYLNGQEETYGNLGNGYQHLAFTWDSSSVDMTGYKNGVLLNSISFGAVTGNWSDTEEPWLLGARDNGGIHADHFGGLLDEVAFYDSTLSATVIEQHFENSRDPQENGLRVYYALDEGNGNQLGNVGSAFLDGGTTFGTEWSALAAHQEVEPHVFTPSTRQVTLNPSVTSVDQVDFTDRSTMAISGFVRYKDTDCFAQNVEILVNGASYNPRIFTDSTGRFVIDFNPGESAVLSPKFADHIFVPAFWEIPNVNNPVAGIVFNDITTRTVSGQVAGGLCKKSIITAPPGSGQGTFCVVKVRTLDGCLERQLTIDNQEGFFEFENLPPFEKLTVAVVEHSNPLIKTAFQVQGGSTVNISERDTMIDFIYTAMPEIEIVSGLEPYSPNCNTIVLEQYENVEVGIRLKEQYVATQNDDGVCYIDSASFHIINGFGDEVKDTTMGDGLLIYPFTVGTPNPSPPYEKNLSIIGSTLDGNDVEYTTLGVITGLRAKDNTFTTVLPETPTMILRDPPGDGSYSFLERNEKYCQKISFEKEVTEGGGLETIIDFGPDITIPTFFGAQNIEFESNIGPDITATSTMTKVDANSVEVCTSLSERISTSEDDLIVGGYQGGDVYVGGGLNIEFGFADIITFDTTMCTGVDSVTVIVVPGDYATTFMYSEWGIKSNPLVYLQNLADNATDTAQQNIYLESIERWNQILSDNAAQKAAAKFVKNISFDAGVTYEYSETSDTGIVESQAMAHNVNLDVDGNLQFYVSGLGGGVVIKVKYESITGQSEDGTTERGITTGYVLKDDDPLDAYTIDVGIDSVYKTPVFNIKAGQTSCPWEYGTAKREGVLLTSVDGPFRTDVPANEPASYQFIMHNISATNETWTYAFTAG